MEIPQYELDIFHLVISVTITMDRNSRGKDAKRFGLVVASCGVMGLILGATNSQAAMAECLNAKTVTSECLTQNPLQKQVEGMSMGLFVGVGAAIGATWQQRQREH